MSTTTLAALLQNFSEQIGDHLTFSTTTNITTNQLVISTDLTSFDDGQDTAFVDWWVYIDGTNNAGVLRQVSLYTSSTGTLTVRGAALSSESGSVTCYLHKLNRDTKKLALNRASEQEEEVLFRKIDDRTLVTGNILPDSHFEDWTSSSALRLYTGNNSTLAQTTTAGLTRGPRGTTSCQVSATSGNGDVRISSDTWPRLLDIMDTDVDIFVWAYPSTADDPVATIYTKDKDGTEQTFPTTTSAVASVWTLLKLETQAIPDNLDEVQVRLSVATSGQNAYFDDLRLFARDSREHLLPEPLRDGEVQQVYVQASGYSDEISDDLFPENWGRVYGSEFFDDGTYKFIRLPLGSSGRQIRLIGNSPLSQLSADADTIEISGQRLNLLIARAAVILYVLEQGPVASEDVGKFFNQINLWERQYARLLPTARIIKTPGQMSLPRA